MVLSKNQLVCRIQEVENSYLNEVLSFHIKSLADLQQIRWF